MQTVTDKTLDVLAKEFSLSRDILIKESLKVFLERKLREIKTEVFRLTGKYRVSSVKELEELYKKGEIEEKDSWRGLSKIRSSGI